MTTLVEPGKQTKAMSWAGWCLTGLVVLFLTMDGVMKFLGLPIVAETMVGLGWPADSAILLGVLTLVPTVLYAIPRTAVLGAILMTAYLGGAVATHVRIGNPLFSHVLFGVYLDVAMWAGLFLRSPRLRSVMLSGV
ncbi:hypothetical protein sos41_18530 [Alphaproteobacteria bacterium SO-S41]|nr:hypothetical protein sos41_18530 [Alphaproteobacteria bacterium SO-S41]